MKKSWSQKFCQIGPATLLVRATALAHHHAKFGPDPPGWSLAIARERFAAQYINWHHTCSGDQGAPGNHQIWPLDLAKTGHGSRFSETGGTSKIRPQTAAARPLFGARPGSQAGTLVDPSSTTVGRRTKRKPLYFQKGTCRTRRRGRPGRPADLKNRRPPTWFGRVRRRLAREPSPEIKIRSRAPESHGSRL